jgi:hypothetical protein
MRSRFIRHTTCGYSLATLEKGQLRRVAVPSALYLLATIRTGQLTARRLAAAAGFYGLFAIVLVFL